MNRAQTPLWIALAVVLATSACVVGMPVLAPATAVPTAIFTLTSTNKPQAAATMAPSATKLEPSLTPSITTTAFPSITPLPSPTATFTNTPFGFVPTSTPVPPTIELSATVESTDTAEGATDDWGSDTRCTLVGKSPANWTVVPPLGKYKVSWTLMNTGKKTWQADSMLLMYYNGARLTNENKNFLVRDVKVGETITPVINIYPPKAPGNYRSVWALRLNKNGHVFCTFTIKITVK